METKVPNLTISEFWKPTLRDLQRPMAGLVQGWSASDAAFPAFREAPLTYNESLSNANPGDATLILISAPGAVGKSTLARQLAAETGAVLVNLAVADPVGGNTISGGLAKSNIFQSWRDEKTTVLIDGLDEARLRVTQEAFEAFLDDVADIAASRSIPTIILGRTGSILEARIYLNSREIKTSIVEIGFYNREASISFAAAQLRLRKPDDTHMHVENNAVELLLDRLRAETQADGDRFAGYAPVLQAVAERVAVDQNPSALVAQINKGEKPVTLKSIVEQILERERSKLRSISLQDETLFDTLYSASEQLQWLVSRVYNVGTPPLPSMSSQDEQVYLDALATWVPEHPFLNGAKDPSSAVFEAVITVEALRSSTASALAVSRELSRGASANPFISEFIFPDDAKVVEEIAPEHVGVLYTSLRAGLSFGDAASLQIDGFDDESGPRFLRAEVEITIVRGDSDQVRVMTFSSDQAGVVKLGSYVEDVEIDMPHGSVEIIGNGEVLLVAPISIVCDSLSIDSEKVIAEKSRASEDAAILLEANSFSGQLYT